MSSTSEANSLGSFIALGTQTSLGTAATTLHKAAATSSGLSARFNTRQPRLEHPSATARATRRKRPTKRVNYLAEVPEIGFALYPKFVVPALLSVGFTVTTTNNPTHYTHVLTLADISAHKWMTAVWSVDESDAAFAQRGVDMRGTSFAMNASPSEILCTLALLGKTLQPMSGSPTYVDEGTEEIVPWNFTRGDITIGETTISEVIRASAFTVDNSLRDDDPRLGSQISGDLGQQEIDIATEFSNINISDELYEELFYGASGGTSVNLDPPGGAIDITFESDNDIAGASVPYSMQIEIPSVEWELTQAPKASGNDMVTLSLKAWMLDDSSTPITVTVVNDVASY
jgi:hypothetical protein